MSDKPTILVIDEVARISPEAWERMRTHVPGAVFVSAFDYGKVPTPAEMAQAIDEDVFREITLTTSVSDKRMTWPAAFAGTPKNRKQRRADAARKRRRRV